MQVAVGHLRARSALIEISFNFDLINVTSTMIQMVKNILPMHQSSVLISSPTERTPDRFFFFFFLTVPPRKFPSLLIRTAFT